MCIASGQIHIAIVILINDPTLSSIKNIIQNQTFVYDSYSQQIVLQLYNMINYSYIHNLQLLHIAAYIAILEVGQQLPLLAISGCRCISQACMHAVGVAMHLANDQCSLCMAINQLNEIAIFASNGFHGIHGEKTFMTHVRIFPGGQSVHSKGRPPMVLQMVQKTDFWGTIDGMTCPLSNSHVLCSACPQISMNQSSQLIL